jgi:hypothetical protein
MALYIRDDGVRQLASELAARQRRDLAGIPRTPGPAATLDLCPRRLEPGAVGTRINDGHPAAARS